MDLIITKTIGQVAANYFLNHYKKHDKNYVVALPTGGTPLSMYQELIKLHQEHSLNFKNIVVFNLDEYVGLMPEEPHSYYCYMQQNLLHYVDVLPKNIHLFKGDLQDMRAQCLHVEEQIIANDGIDLLVCGLGDNGHIAFNEPYSSFESLTHIVNLSLLTRMQNARFFNHDIEAVPKQAITMGIKTILTAKKIVVLAQGINKAQVVRELFEGNMGQICPATALQMHPNVTVICDEYATYELKYKTIANFTKVDNS